LSSEQALDLEFLAADSGRFVSVYFSQMQRAIGQSDARDAFALSPASASVDSAEPGYLANARPYREGFDVRDFTNNFKVHFESFSAEIAKCSPDGGAQRRNPG
jgi:hypothetical protein